MLKAKFQSGNTLYMNKNSFMVYNKIFRGPYFIEAVLPEHYRLRWIENYKHLTREHSMLFPIESVEENFYLYFPPYTTIWYDINGA